MKKLLIASALCTLIALGGACTVMERLGLTEGEQEDMLPWMVAGLALSMQSEPPTTPPPPALTGWNHQAYLKSQNNSNSDYFGYSAAVSGNTLVVGAYNELSSTNEIINGSDLSATNDSTWNAGAVYVYVRSGSTWRLQAYLKSPNNGGDAFGYSVAIDGDTVVVGARNEDSNTTAVINGTDLSTTNNSAAEAGAAYVFTRSNDRWSHQAYLKPPAATMANDSFGYSVAISGDTIIVGAPNEDSNTTAVINGTDLSSTNDNGTNSGAAHVFTRAGTTWSHQAYLKSPNAANTQINDNFGMSVAISGDTALVGAPREDSGTQAIIHGTDLTATNDSALDAGAAHVFTRAGTTWSHQAYLKAPNTSASDYFGQSVAVSGDTVAVGASGEDSSTTAIINGTDLSSTNNAAGAAGAVYVYARAGSTWSHQAYLKAPVPASGNANSTYTAGGDEFGYSVAISGDVIVVGARYEDSNSSAIINSSDMTGVNEYGIHNGAAYVMTRTGTTWTCQAYLKAPNASNDDEFGTSVSVSGDTVVVGAHFEDHLGTSVINGTDLSSAVNLGFQNGAAYVFKRE